MTKYIIHVAVEVDDEQPKPPTIILHNALTCLRRYLGIKKLEILGSFELK